MRITLFLLSTFLAGCAPYTRAQLDLTEQARRGVATFAAAQEAAAGRALQLHDLRRRRIDEAFDADVRQTPELSPDWVIEHRRAYSAALDALARQDQARRDADAAVQQNVRATDLALQRLQWLQRIQLKLNFAQED